MKRDKNKKSRKNSKYLNIKELIIDDDISEEIIKAIEERIAYQKKTRNVSIGEY
jgi:hypothetical protein